MKRYTLTELQAMPTIEQGHTDDLKVFFPNLFGKGYGLKVWLSRLTVADGQPYDNEVTVEQQRNGVWYTIDTYPAVCCGPCQDDEHADDGTGQNCPCCGVDVPETV